MIQILVLAPYPGFIDDETTVVGIFKSAGAKYFGGAHRGRV
jgi:hypothetical protein